MVKATGYGVTGTASGKEALVFILLIIGIIIAAMWYIKSSLTAPFSTARDAISSVTKTVTNEIVRTYEQVTDPKSTVTALAGSTPYASGGASTRTTQYCPNNPTLLSGDARCIATLPSAYETQESVATREAALPEWEAAFVNAGNFITGGLASAAGAELAGKTISPETQHQIGEQIYYKGKYWTISGISPTNYLLDDGAGGSYNPLISEIDIDSGWWFW